MGSKSPPPQQTQQQQQSPPAETTTVSSVLTVDVPITPIDFLCERAELIMSAVSGGT